MLKTTPRDMIYIILFLVLVLAMWTGLSLLPGPVIEHVPYATRGSHDLTGTDFTDTIYRLEQAWETWPGKLYTPDELEDAEEPIQYNCDQPCATHRETLKLTPGITYGISNRSSDYAMRMFLNGEEIVTAGNPGATEEENVPGVREFVYYFTPQTETVEIVVQSSNYIHYRDGTKAPLLLIGTAENIADYVRNFTLKSGIIFGCLVMAFLYHLAVFLLNRRQLASLVFGLLCLVVGIYSTERFVSLTLTVYRLGYVAMIFSVAGLVLLVNILFPDTLNKRLLLAYFAICGAYLVMSLLAHPLLVTRVLQVFQIISICMIVYSLVCLILKRRERELKNALAFLGVALFGLSTLYDILYKNGLGPNLLINDQRVVDGAAGMVLMVTCYAMVIAIEQTEVNRRLEEAKTALAAAKARYIALSQEKENGNLAEKAPTSFSELGLTRREKEIALLLLDGRRRDEIAELLSISRGTINTHCTNIYRKANVTSVTEFTRLMLPRGGTKEKNDEKAMILDKNHSAE